MPELENNTQFENPKMSEVMDLVKRMKEDIVYFRTRPQNQNNILQQMEQEYNDWDWVPDVFDGEDEISFFNEVEDLDESLPHDDYYLVNELPRRLKQAIQMIMQFSSTSYQLHILRQAFTTILFKKESQKGSYINEQFLSTFERAWIQLEFQEKLQHEQANIYTTLRENIQTYYYPEKQIFNHLSPKIQNEIPDVLLYKIHEKHKILKEEINALLPSENDRLIGKPLVKINKLREHLMQLEPCISFKEFINNDYRFLKKADLFQAHEKMVEQYKEMVQNFKSIEYEAYRGQRIAMLL